jgi:hypothetical protein
MSRFLLIVFLLFSCSAVAQQQSYSKMTVDYVENNRRCRNDAAVVRNCNVAYGHYTMTEAAEYNTQPLTLRLVLLCETTGQELGRKDCIPLEAGKTYAWTSGSSQRLNDVGDMYSLYGDFTALVYITTPQGRGWYVMKDLRPERR